MFNGLINLTHKGTLGFLILAVLCSCAGKQEGKSDVGLSVNLKKGAIIDSAIGVGGAMFWGKRDDGQDGFARVISAGGADLALTLSNGNWTFNAIAFEGGSGGMTGTVRCGAASASLTGEKVAIALTVSNAGCAGTTYSEHDMSYVTSEYSFPLLDIGSCYDLSGVSVGTEIASCMIDSGTMKSFKVHMPEYDKIGGALSLKSSKVTSECISVHLTPTTSFQAGGSAINTTDNLPVVIGAPGSPVYTQLEGFYNSYDCGVTQNNGGRVIEFPNGIGANDSTNYKTFKTTGGGYVYVTAFLKTTDAELCQGARTTDLVNYAGGDGTTLTNPIYICSPAQWNAFANSWSSPLSGYNIKLAADLDFAYGTFVPMGDAIPGAVSFPYSGVFNGNNHRIKNIEVVSNNQFGVGIFRALSSGTIKNLIVDDVDIDAESSSAGANGDSGGLVGKIIGSAILDNIKISGNIYSDDESEGTGLVLGTCSTGCTATLTNVHAYGTIISAGTGVGTLIGSGVGCTAINVTQSSASGRIEGSRNYPNTRVGGLIGGAACTVTMNESLYKGELTGQNEIGGLVGYGSNLIINDSYAAAVVSSRKWDSALANVGGAVGTMAGGTLTRVLAPEAVVNSENVNPHATTAIGENMAYSGGLVGNKTAGACNDSFFVGPNNSTGSGPFGVGNITFKGCGTYYNLATGTGSISDINSYTGIWASAATYINTTPNSGSTAWVHETADNEKDYPRLRWEYAVENSIPYLKRPCAGTFAGTVGSGTAADPYWICSLAQFTAMSPANHYILKKNLDLRDQTLNDAAPTFLGTGAFKFDGNNLNIYGPIIDIDNATTSAAIIGTLSSGGYFKNVTINSPKIDVSYGAGSGSPITGAQAAVVATNNAGTIDNTFVYDGKVSFIKKYLQNGGTNTMKLSAYVIQNSGTISNTSIDAKFTLWPIDTSGTPYNGEIFFSHVAYENTGTMQAVRTNGEMKVYANVAADMPTANWFGSGMVIHNTAGSISESSSGGHFNMEFSVVPGGYGTLAGVVAGNNTGSITDVLSETTFSLTRFNGNVSGLVGNHSGSMTRVLYRPYETNTVQHNTPAQAKGIILTGGGSVSEGYCGTPWEYSLQKTSGTWSATNGVAYIPFGGDTALDSYLSGGSAPTPGTRLCMVDSTPANPIFCDYFSSYGNPNINLATAPGATYTYDYFNLGMKFSDCSEDLDFVDTAGVLEIAPIDLGVTGSDMTNGSWSVTSDPYDLDLATETWYMGTGYAPVPVATEIIYGQILDGAYFP